MKMISYSSFDDLGMLLLVKLGQSHVRLHVTGLLCTCLIKREGEGEARTKKLY
jgi:hypothetical protein